MGLRGRLPQVALRHATPLTDLSPPPWLTAEAAAHWTRHAQALAGCGLLTTQTADSYALLCDLWGRLCDLRAEATGRVYLDTWRAYVSAAKPWRMIPCDPPSQAVEHRHADRPAFEL